MKAIGSIFPYTTLFRSQDDHWNAFEILIGFDFCQDLSAILLGQIEVKEDEIRRSDASMLALPAEIGQCFDSIADHRQSICHFGLSQGFPGETDVSRAIF